MISVQDQIKAITGMYCMDDMEEFLYEDDYLQCESLQSWLETSEYDNDYIDNDYFDMET